MRQMTTYSEQAPVATISILKIVLKQMNQFTDDFANPPIEEIPHTQKKKLFFQ